MSDVKHSREPKNQSQADLMQFEKVEKLFSSSTASFVDKIDAFPKFATRQAMAKFITKYEIFRKILHVNGSIVEGGVLHGGGTLAWAKLSSILEPTNHTRKIIGFDTFSGFPSIDKKDTQGTDGSLLYKGALTGSTHQEVLDAVEVYDLNRPLAHIPKVELVKGDIAKTSKEYLKDNPHLIVSLLYLDVDLYEPTKVMIETFLPRMPKGAIIAFDELNAKVFPGETVALLETIGLNKLALQRFEFDSYVSYAQIG